MIQIRGLHKSFNGNHVLRGVDLEIQTGEALVIIGRSGCGKSVLLKQIMGIMTMSAIVWYERACMLCRILKVSERIDLQKKEAG